MKCSNCGNNLEIDNEVCPFCGSVNPIAKQHREDMKKYAKDYDVTKENVISKSKRVNEKAIKIAAIAFTVAAFAILLPFLVSVDEIGRQYKRDKAIDNEENCVPELMRLIEADDYLAVDEYAKKTRLTRQFALGGKYYNVIFASAQYASLFQDIMCVISDSVVINERTADNISYEIKTLENRMNLTVYDIPEECQTYIEHLYADTKLLLKTYLNISEEKYDELMSESDNQRSISMLEVLNETRK